MLKLIIKLPGFLLGTKIVNENKTIILEEKVC
jgi:hypothetical protein